jgi:hypothetical protein
MLPFPDKPSPPENVKVKEVGKDYVIVSWESPESDGGSPITGFIVERRDVTKSSWVGAGRVDAETFYQQITKLTEGNEYEIHVAAENEIGQSDWAVIEKPVKARLAFGKCTSN